MSSLHVHPVQLYSVRVAPHHFYPDYLRDFVTILGCLDFSFVLYILSISLLICLSWDVALSAHSLAFCVSVVHIFCSLWVSFLPSSCLLAPCSSHLHQGQASSTWPHTLISHNNMTSISFSLHRHQLSSLSDGGSSARPDGPAFNSHMHQWALVHRRCFLWPLLIDSDLWQGQFFICPQGGVRKGPQIQKATSLCGLSKFILWMQSVQSEGGLAPWGDALTIRTLGYMLCAGHQCILFLLS